MISQYYELFKSLHIIAVISWMAAILYLPRLYVYHVGAKLGSELDKTLQIMEHRLLRYIMNPAMIATIVFGFFNAHIYGFSALGTWFYIKMLFVVILMVFHGFLAKWRKEFAIGENNHSSTFFRVMNEVPTVCMIVAVLMVVIKPFE
jgi:putative membrane protein